MSARSSNERSADRKSNCSNLLSVGTLNSICLGSAVPEEMVLDYILTCDILQVRSNCYIGPSRTANVTLHRPESSRLLTTEVRRIILNKLEKTEQNEKRFESKNTSKVN